MRISITLLFIIQAYGWLFSFPLLSTRYHVSSEVRYQEDNIAHVNSFEERLLVTIPADYKEPGIYGGVMREDVAIYETGLWAYSLSYQKKGTSWSPACSPGCAKIAYRAKQAGKEFIVIGGRKGPEFDQVQSPIFSPDGSRMAYVAKKGGKQFIVIGEQIGEQYDSVGSPAFSPDGKSVAYSACLNNKCFVVAGNQRGIEFHEVSSSPIFSPDSSKVAYIARKTKTGNALVILWDKQIAEHSLISGLTFSPDNNHLIYSVSLGTNEWQMIMGDRKGSNFNIILKPVFNADGSKVAYAAIKSGAWHVVIEDQLSPQGNRIMG